MTKIKLLSLAFLAFFFIAGLSAQSVLGVWKTVDDKTGKPKSHIRLYEKNGKLFGKVVKLLPDATTTVCNDCPGKLNGKSLLDIDVLWDMEKVRNGYDNGRIVDPADGKVYRCKLHLSDPNTLTVRGYIGISLLGRNQTWHRVK